MKQIWIYFVVGFSFFAMQVKAVHWPTCGQIADAQEAFNKEDNIKSAKFFQAPACAGIPKTYRFTCEPTCCTAEMEGKVIHGIMASPYQAIRHIVDGMPDPVGEYPVPFFFYDKSSAVFDLAPWDPSDVNKFKFTIRYVQGIAFLEYTGNVKEGSNRLFAPFMSPTWEAFTDAESEILYKQVSLKRTMQQQAQASECSCGYYQSMRIRSIEGTTCPDSQCYKSYHAEYTCKDIDECEEGTHNCDLIPNTHCVNSIGSFECVCNPGYYSVGPGCLADSPTIASAATPTSTSARIKVISDALPKPSWSYSFNVSDISNPSYPLPVFQATQVKVSQVMAISGVQISNLNPGTNYSVTWDVLDENSTVITEKYSFNSDSRFKTLCTCGFQTDAPVLLGDETITQENGFVYFKFLGNSMCGNAYTFARQSYHKDGSLSKHTVFTPNYFFTGAECSPVPYEPGKSATDALANSKLIVGANYRYSIRAVGNKYLGDVSSMDFTIRWESSISGFVGLQPFHGELPVENVIVRWALKNESGNTVLDGVTSTTKSGRFTIHPNALIPFKNDHDYPMHISFTKVTKIDETHQINHRFLCNNGRTNCTDTDLVVHLKHLDFDVPVNVIDATTVPVSGKVYVADTKTNPDGTLWGGDGCPVANAKVCLVDRSPSGFSDQLICTDTASDGTYVLPAVFGSRVSINVIFENHEFEYSPRKGFPDFSNGIEIQPNQIYEHNDFMDTTTVPLELTIAGGACDLFLGVAKVSYKINGCPWKGATVLQQNLQEEYKMIPAQNLMFQVYDIATRPDISMAPQNLDLTLVPSQNSSRGVDTSSKDLENATSISQLRFQYDGVAKIRLAFAHEENNDCATTTPDIASLQADSLHVLPFQLPTNVTIFIERDLGAGLYCDAVDSSSQVVIQNNLGLQPGDSSDDIYAAAVAETMPHEALELLYHCSHGCVTNVIQDYDPILQRKTRARVEFQFMTGRPNNAEPFVKRFIVKTQEAKSVSYTAAVVVTGQYKRGDLYTVGLPTYNPILIIRDPPGGSSYTFYENVETTLRIESRKHTEYKGQDTNFNSRLGVNMDTGACAGLGFQACSSVLKLKDVAAFRFSGSSHDLTQLKSNLFSGGFTTTWSYKTSSGNPLFTGNASDTYIIPNLNVKFSLIDTVSWNQSTCTASMIEETAYNLQSPENVPALAFVTGAEIMWTEIPSLESNIATAKAKLDDATTEAERAQLQNELNAFEDALQGWLDALALNEELKQKTINGNATYQVKPHQWFEKMASKRFSNHSDSINTAGMSHNSALFSDDLMARAQLRPLYQSAGSSMTDLESTNTIKFAGGGSEFTYRLSTSKMKQHVSDLGGTQKSSSNIGGGTVIDNTFVGINFAIEFNSGSITEKDTQNFQTDEDSGSTSVGFVLSDPDAGDQIDVDIFIDPVFGTFVFHTRSGKTLCKHEPGTENRQEVKLELISMPPTVVFEDEEIVFHYRITKLGWGTLGYTLSLEMREDSDGLHYFPRLPREYSIIEYGESIIATISVSRGPEKYEYPAVQLIVQPTCEFRMLALLGEEATLAKIELYNYIDPVDQTKKIVFARPCAPVILQGDIGKDHQFKSTSANRDESVKVVVQNPESSVMTWAEAIQDSTTRLKRVQLVYRSTGSKQWLVGQHLVNGTLVDIDFATVGLEDAYGFATIGWEVSHLTDGDYEMQVRTMCDDVSDAPAIFNGQQTAVVQGVIDRKAPKLYGLPQPQSQLPIGQPITLTFDESLDCSLPLKFGVEVKVEGIEAIFDHDNLMLICEERTISIQFDGTSTNLEHLVSKRLNLVLTHVADVNGNLIVKPVSYSVEIVAADNGQGSWRRVLDESSLKEEVEELRREIKQNRLDMMNFAAEIKETVRDLLLQMPAGQ